MNQIEMHCIAILWDLFTTLQINADICCEFWCWHVSLEFQADWWKWSEQTKSEEYQFKHFLWNQLHSEWQFMPIYNVEAFIFQKQVQISCINFVSIIEEQLE